jgi:hypothetical protein
MVGSFCCLFYIGASYSTAQNFALIDEGLARKYPFPYNGTCTPSNVLATLARLSDDARLEPDRHRLQHFYLRVFGFITLHYSISRTNSAAPKRTDSGQVSKSLAVASTHSHNSGLASQKADSLLYVMYN